MLMSPTGSGKTHIAMEIIKDGLKHGKRITFVCDRITLVDQTSDKFMDAGISCSIQQGSHPMYRPNLPVQVCSAQTLARRKDWTPADLVIVDEAHTQHKAIHKQMDKWDGIKWIGLSATPFTRGLGLQWKNLVRSITTKELIDQGYLSTYVAYGHSQPDLSRVRTIAGDFAVGDMEAPCNEIVGSVVQHYKELGEDRKALGFAVNVAHAHELAEEFQRNGIVADYVDGKDTPERRQRVMTSFRNGETRVLFNCEVLTKGLDVPDIEVLLLARPTKSLTLHIQMLGRGLRTADGKDHCLILDHAGNIERMGFPDDDLPTEMSMEERGVNKVEKKDKDDPLPWNCPDCHHIVPIKTRQCPCCGFLAKAPVEVVVEKGVLQQLKTKNLSNKQNIYSQLLCIAQDRGYAKGWVSHKYKAIFGVFPRKVRDTIEVPTPELRSWIKSQQIRYAKRRDK